MPVSTLSHLATKACVASISRIYDVGDCPYHAVRPVLLKVENHKQLRQIEEASPQICGLDAECWRNLIKRDIPNCQSKDIEPKNPRNWWKVYRKLKREADQEIAEQTAALKAALLEKKLEKDKLQMTFTDKMPSKKRTRTTPNFTVGGSSARSLGYGTSSRTKIITGKDIIERARRQAREQSVFRVTPNEPKTLGQLQGKGSSLRQPPRIFTNFGKAATKAYLPTSRFLDGQQKTATISKDTTPATSMHIQSKAVPGVLAPDKPVSKLPQETNTMRMAEPISSLPHRRIPPGIQSSRSLEQRRKRPGVQVLLPNKRIRA